MFTAKTPAKHVKHIDGLLTLSSSNKKKFSLKNPRRKRQLLIEMKFKRGSIRSESFIRFVLNIFEYILYDRMAIPLPYQFKDKLNFQVESEQQKMLLMKTFAKLNAVFDFISTLFVESAVHMDCLAICLGDTINFAKEIFILNFELLNIEYKHHERRPNQAMNGPKQSVSPQLSLRYMINNFYQRLLNEIPEEMPEYLHNQRQQQMKLKFIFFTIKIRTNQIGELKQFIDDYNSAKSNDNPDNFTIKIFSSTYRLGTNLSYVTRFKFSHLTEDNFDIFVDNNDGEDEDEYDEVIEEKIDLINKNRSSLDDRRPTDATNGDNTAPKMANIDEIGDNPPNGKSTEAPPSSTNDQQPPQNIKDDNINDNDLHSSIWLQICSPIRCMDKL